MPNSETETFPVRYPISIIAVMVSVISFYCRYKETCGLKAPLAKTMRGLAEYAGHTYGYLRTMLSLWKTEKLLDCEGTRKNLRWSFGAKFISIQNRIVNADTSRDEFTFAIFSFSTDEHRKRRITRELLRHLKFKMLAPNAYVNTFSDTAGIHKSLMEFGLERNVFLFDTKPADNPFLIEKIRSLWDIDDFIRSAESFRETLNVYLRGAPGTEEEAYCRYLFAASGFYENIKVKKPSLPSRFFPPVDALDEIQRVLDDYELRNLNSIIAYYRKTNE